MPAPYAQPGSNRRPAASRTRPAPGDARGATPHAGSTPSSQQPGRNTANLQAISAPYNFVPLANWVHIPQWSRLVSHDLPWREGYSGEIVYTLTAHTPLLVGGTQTKASDQTPGEVRPFQLPDGRYAIPGSSLKGMLRAVVEIAGFGRMRFVDDVRPGLRDISGKYVAASYTEKVRNRVHTGFMRLRADGGARLIPCSMARLYHRDVEAALGVRPPLFDTRLSVRDKYAKWNDLCRQKGLPVNRIRFELSGGAGDATSLLIGSLVGMPVFTGQVSASWDGEKQADNPTGKKRDFLFFDPRENDAIDVPEDAWRDFLAIHGDDQDDTSAMPWPGYWRAIYRNGGDVPVFYVRDGALLRLGLAYMPKLAGDFSTLQMIEHRAREHRQPPGLQNGYDFADLLFGAINDDEADKKRGTAQADALRGRVSVETAVALTGLQPSAQPVTILNGPKPTFFPNYVTQPNADEKTGKLRDQRPQYATYIASGGNRAPTLRGFKRYPVRPLEEARVQEELTEEQRNNPKVQVRLHTLPAGAKFSGRIVFHNLRPEELGALLWAMTWGGDPELRHALGMGKPFGFGQVSLTISDQDSRLIPNDPQNPPCSLDDAQQKTLRERFVKEMDAAVERHAGGGSWLQTPQMRNLLAMADPRAASAWCNTGRKLEHMRLKTKGPNEFDDAKKLGLVLAEYAVATKYIPGRLTAAAQPVQQGQQTLGPAVLRWDKGKNTLSISGKDSSGKMLTAATFSAEETNRLIASLPEPQREKLKKKGELSSVRATVEFKGNRYQIIGLETAGG